MMSEMARKLQERRRRADEGAASGDTPEGSTENKKPWERGGNGNTATNGNGSTNKFPNGAGAESPRMGRNKRFQSLTGQENIAAMVTANGGAAATSGNQSPENMDAFKQEILQEMRREIQKAKLEIIDAIKMEMNRR